MANYQNILRQAHQAIADVADNADSWRAFLRSAAYTTHYAFPNQALIYSQRPGATMLADIDTWNRAAGRWVNRGARGVASLGTGHMAGNVRYLFDIKDTHPAGKGAKPLGWQITDANRYPTLQALQEKHNAESLPEIFGLQAALFVAQHGKQLDADLQNAVIGSTLEWAKPQEQTAIFANLITQSAVYMAAVRCGLGDSAVPQLYQKANIQITGFEKADLPDSFFDVVIGNVPFGDYSVVDPRYNRLHFKIHDYFIAKSIDKLRTGGIIAFITTSGTLDKKSEEVRRYINARCDFIGAVRLPDSTFKSAGTKAMADIIFLQKRDRILEQDASWLHTTQTEDGLSLNSYFAEHPEMVCGTLKTVSGPYGQTLTCEAFADKPLPDVLKEAMSHLHAEFHFQNIELQESGAVEASIPAEPDVRNFSFCIRNGKFYYRENAIMREVSLGATSAARMRLLIELRDTTRELIQAQQHPQGRCQQQRQVYRQGNSRPAGLLCQRRAYGSHLYLRRRGGAGFGKHLHR